MGLKTNTIYPDTELAILHPAPIESESLRFTLLSRYTRTFSKIGDLCGIFFLITIEAGVDLEPDSSEDDRELKSCWSLVPLDPVARVFFDVSGDGG